MTFRPVGTLTEADPNICYNFQRHRQFSVQCGTLKNVSEKIYSHKLTSLSTNGLIGHLPWGLDWTWKKTLFLIKKTHTFNKNVFRYYDLQMSTEFSGDNRMDGNETEPGVDSDSPIATNLLQEFKSFDHIRASTAVITVINSIQFAAYGVYLIMVTFQYLFFYGYLNMKLLPISQPGTFIDWRYNFFWYLLFIQVGRLLMYFLYQWVANAARNFSWWVFAVHRGFTLVYIVFDLLNLIILLVMKWFCNVSFIPDNPCNDPINYCKAFGTTWPSLCPTGSFDPSFDPLSLKENFTFILDLFFSIGFLFLDIAQLPIASGFRTTLVRYVSFNYLKS